ncbi:putative membrane protein [Francisella philomiragia]|uniref:Putative membrane protein n=1 Tax=Francisella philomiragia TaxID=28110 RepID=A0A0B6CYQ7_9GAMM|nr:putative membrane protein [Francisella philomiragia]
MININSLEKLVQLLGINKTLFALLISALTFIYTKSFAWSIVTFCLTYFLTLLTNNLFLT